jgi:hypothetical protein
VVFAVTVLLVVSTLLSRSITGSVTLLLDDSQRCAAPRPPAAAGERQRGRGVSEVPAENPP